MAHNEMDWKYKMSDNDTFIDKSISLDISYELKSIIDKAKMEKEKIFNSYSNYSIDSSTTDIIKQNNKLNDYILINIEDDEDNSLIKSIYSNISFKVPDNLFHLKDNTNVEEKDNKNFNKMPIDYSYNSIDLKNENINVNESFQFQFNNLKKYINDNANPMNSEIPSFKLNTSFNYSEINNEFQKFSDSQKTEIISNIIISIKYIYIL